MTTPELFRVEVTVDKPTSGMWHCGPNPSWVTVTHIPTMTQARAYHRSQHKAREAAMACVQMMLADLLCENDQCSFPEALDTRAPLSPAVLAELPEVRALVAAETERCAKIADPPLMHRKGKPGLWRTRRAAIAAAIREARNG
jgi:hypothetical protein